MSITDVRTLQPALVLRAAVYTAVRRFFAGCGYLEVETPLRIPAPLPEAHIEVQSSGSWYLQPSPEACMKRLLAAGLPRIYQICKCFRREERGRRHLPELTMLEWYTAGADYRQMMIQCEDLIGCVLQDLKMSPRISYQGRTIDLQPPWQRLSVARAFEAYGSLNVGDALAQDCFDEIMGLAIEPCLGWERPVFLYDYPAQCGALARRKSDNADLVERCELYIGGIELCNAFSELTDAAEQSRRFERENRTRRSHGRVALPWPDGFLKALADMPAASGNALGLDRLMMLLADTDTIDDVVAFTPEEL